MSESLIALAEIVKSLNQTFTPHKTQAELGRAILYEGSKRVMAVCGRSWGKTRTSAYLNVRMAMETPFATNYIFLPFLTQAREVYWSPKVLQQIIPEGWIESENQTEMRITLINGSFIKVCGADNVDSYRGVKLNAGSIAVFDEFQNFKDDFTEAFLPNLSVNDPALLIIGTPPSIEGQFTSFMKLAQESPKWRYFHYPSWMNPHVSNEFIEQERKRLYDMGEGETFEREIAAVFVKGGKKSIYPMFINMEKKPLEDIWPKDANKWTVFVSCDPAATSVFGVLFGLHNPYTKRLIIFDELYIDEPSEMVARRVMSQIQEKLETIKNQVRDIRYVFDEAAAFFRNETNEEFPDIWLEPSRKKELGIEGFISLTKTILIRNFVEVSHNCTNFINEMERYEKDDHGRIPDKDDHLINCFWYMAQAAGYNLNELLEPKTKPLEDERRGFSLESELALDSMEELDGFG